MGSKIVENNEASLYFIRALFAFNDLAFLGNGARFKTCIEGIRDCKIAIVFSIHEEARRKPFREENRKRYANQLQDLIYRFDFIEFERMQSFDSSISFEMTFFLSSEGSSVKNCSFVQHTFSIPTNLKFRSKSTCS